MRYTITLSQLNYFRKEGKIEFEEIYKGEEVTSLKGLLDAAKGASRSSRDLQSNNPPILNALHPSRLGQLASNLFDKKRLRIAFTEFGGVEKVKTIEEMSSFSETCGGCILNLESGTTTFYHTQTAIDFSLVPKPWLLVVFASDRARYKLQESDSHTHDLKKLGYGFGDLISEKTHPLIVK